MEPIVTVAVRSYRYWRFVKECLESLKRQTFALPFEVLVIQDGGDLKDSEWQQTVAVLQAVKPTLPVNFRVIFLPGQNRGHAAMCNEVLRRARGQVLMFVDSDDLVGSEYVKYLYHAWYAFNRAGKLVVFADCTRFFCDAEGRENGRAREPFRLGDNFASVGALMAAPVALLRTIGGWNEKLSDGNPLRQGEDYALIERFRRLGINMAAAHTPAENYLWRQHVVLGRTDFRRDRAAIEARIGADLKAGNLPLMPSPIEPCRE